MHADLPTSFNNSRRTGGRRSYPSLTYSNDVVLDLHITNIIWCHLHPVYSPLKSALKGLLSVAPKCYIRESLKNRLSSVRFYGEHKKVTVSCFIYATLSDVFWPRPIPRPSPSSSPGPRPRQRRSYYNVSSLVYYMLSLNYRNELLLIFIQKKMYVFDNNKLSLSSNLTTIPCWLTLTSHMVHSKHSHI